MHPHPPLIQDLRVRPQSMPPNCHMGGECSGGTSITYWNFYRLDRASGEDSSVVHVDSVGQAPIDLLGDAESSLRGNEAVLHDGVTGVVAGQATQSVVGLS